MVIAAAQRMASKCQLCGAVLASNIAACGRCGFLDTFGGGELIGEREFSFGFENDPAILALSAAVEVAGSRIRLAHEEHSERVVGVNFPSDEDSFPGDEQTHLTGLRSSRETFEKAAATPLPAALTPVPIPLALVAAGLALLALLALLACLMSFVGGASVAFAVRQLQAPPSVPSVSVQPTPRSETDEVPGLTPRDRP